MLLLQLAQQTRHLDRGERRVGALVPGLRPGALDGLLDRIDGQDAEADRNAVSRALGANPLLASPAT